MDGSCLHNYSALWEHHRNQRLREGRDSHGAICREHCCQDLVSRWSHKGCVQSLEFIALGSSVWSQQPSSSHSGAEHSSLTPRAVVLGCAYSLLMLGHLARQQAGTGEGSRAATGWDVQAQSVCWVQPWQKSCLSSHCCCSASLPSAPCFPSIAYSWMPVWMWMEVSSPHTFPQNTQLFWWEVSPTVLLVLALKKERVCSEHIPDEQ